MSINHLPNEILSKIFKLLKHEEIYEGALAQCALTCRQWRQPAQVVLYSALKIDSMERLDAIMDTNNELGNYVQSIYYRMDFCRLSMLKIASLCKNLVNFDCLECSDKLINMLCLLKKGFFSALRTMPSPTFDSEKYDTCLEIMKDRLTEINLVIQGDKSGTYFSTSKKLELFPKLNTIRMDFSLNKNYMVWKHFEAVSAKVNIKTLFIQPSTMEDFSFDMPIIPKSDVETLSILDPACLNNSFMLYVMKRFAHLKRLNVMCSGNHFNTHFNIGRKSIETFNPVSFLKYLYSLQTATGIFLEINLEELPKHLLSLLNLLDEKQLQDTIFKLDFKGYYSRYEAAVFDFTRQHSRNTIFIILDEMLNLQLIKGNFFYRLHLKWLWMTDDLEKILNAVSAYCPRLDSLIISQGGHYNPGCSPIIKNYTVKRLELRDYQIAPQLFTLIHNQFPRLEDLVLYGFYCWDILENYFPMVAPLMSIKYFRLRLDLYSDESTFEFKKVFIKLETMDQENRYYDLNPESPDFIVERYLFPHTNSTEAEYQKSIDDDSYMTLFIKFKSIAKFVPTFSHNFKNTYVEEEEDLTFPNMRHIID